MDMLLGLDMLRRHQCVLDLHKNVLRIANSVETSFLPESELPTHARLSGNANDVDEGDFERLVDDAPPNRTSQSTASTAASSAFSEESIKHITKSGFSREQAVEELKLTNGDATKALVSLMAKSLSVPKRKR